jgi:type I restriction enzyme S subunit
MREGWIETTLGEVAEWWSGGTPKAREPKYYENGIIAWAVIADMNKGVIDSTNSYITQEALDLIGGRLAPVGSVLISMYASVGKSAIANVPLATNQAIAWSIPNKSKIIPYYLYLVSQQLEKEISDLARGATQRNINRQMLREFTFLLPPLTEQKRIVDLISSVDSYIGALHQQVDKARKSRNAVIHEFLARGRDGWVETTLGEVATWGSGGTPKADNFEFYGGNIPWCVIGDLNEGQVFDTEKKITDLGLKNSSAKKIEPGHVLIAMYGASIGKTGIASVEMATNQAIAFAKVHENLVTNRYLLIYLQSQKNKFVEAGQGAAQPNISQTVLKSWPFSLPPIEVQNAFVEVISSFDNQIQAIGKTMYKTKDLRSALLSDLLSGNHEIPTTYDKIIGAA